MDLHDPATWPDTPGALLDALDSGAVNDDASGEDAVDAAPAVPAVEEPAAGEAAGSGGAKLVPVSALAELRAELQTQKAHALELEQQVQALSQPAATVDSTAGSGAVSAAGADAGLDALIAEAEADGDQLLATALRTQQQQAARLVRLEQALQQQEATAARGQQDAVVAAFESAPLLKAWAEDTAHPAWHQTAVQLHHAMQADPAYQALSLAQQFARLPELVEQQLGVASPHRAALEPAGQSRGATQRAAAEPGVPLSMTHIPGGLATEPQPRNAADLEGLSETEQAAALLRVANDPQALWAFLDEMAPTAGSRPKRAR